jgi:NADH-quinone oxidoreductase subunit A
MPETLAQQYFPVLVQVALAVGMAVGLVATGLLLGKRVRSQVKEMPYECGITPTGTARERFSVKFYLVAMLFILFDIEAVFLYPWAMVFRELKWVAFVEMILFMVLILSGFFYIWKKGALNWTVEETSRQRAARRAPQSVSQMVESGLLEPTLKP